MHNGGNGSGRNKRRAGERQRLGLTRVIFRHPDELEPSKSIALNLDAMSDIDLMIANGWGNTPQTKMPSDWRTRHKGPK